MWCRSRSAKVDWIDGSLQMPCCYLVDLRRVVERDRYVSRTRIATTGGFIPATLLTTLVHGLGLHGQILGFALLAATVLMFVGVLPVAHRRLDPPSRLSRGFWICLPKSLLASAASLFPATLPVAGILPEDFGGWFPAGFLTIGMTWDVSELFLGMIWGGPMEHTFAGVLHLIQHRHAERSGGGRSTGLKALDLTDPHVPPDVEKPSGFTWNQLLGFDVCVQYGKCEMMCPVFATGQPLSPEKLIQGMAIDLAGDNDVKFAGSPCPGKSLDEYGGGPHQPTVALDGKALVDTDTLQSCTTHRAYVEECPTIIEHVDTTVGMRYHLTLEKGATPSKGAKVLDSLIVIDNPGGFAPGGRLNWAADLNLSLISEKKSADVLFWVGDGTFDMRDQHTLCVFVKILKMAAVDFAILDLEERDSGDVVYWLGNEVTLQNLARRNIATLTEYRFTRIVSYDPYSFRVLKNEYDAPDDDYQVLHHGTFINELLRADTLQPGRSKAGSVTYHDPCYLGHYNGEYEASYNVLRALSIEVREMQHSGFRSHCCGGGGDAPTTDIPGKQRIPDMHMVDIRETGAELVAVGCPQRTVMLEGVITPRSKIKDVAGLVAEAPVERAETPAKKPVWHEAVTGMR